MNQVSVWFLHSAEERHEERDRGVDDNAVDYGDKGVAAADCLRDDWKCRVGGCCTTGADGRQWTGQAWERGGSE